MTNNITTWSATKTAQAIKSKKVSATEVVTAYCKQIEIVNPKINALIQQNVEQSLHEAKKVDDQIAAGKISGALLGVPVTIKNACKVKNFQPDKSSTGLAGKTCEEDATVVARLRAEGAIILGLTNCPELSIGYETDNNLYGRTSNPYDFSLTSGGSSGGEAALLAACGSALGIGSDATGSIRVPAHFCGISSLRATQGRIPMTGNLPIDGPGLFSQFFSFGPMARYVEDCALALNIIAGPDQLDSHVAPVSLRDHTTVDLNSLRIAYYTDDEISKTDSDTQNVINNTVSALQNHVAEIIADRPTCLKEMEADLNQSIILGGDRGQWLIEILHHLKVSNPSPLLLSYLEYAKQCEFSVTDLRKQWQRFDAYRSNMLQFIQAYDVILCPVAATPAKLHGTTYQGVDDFSHSMVYSLVNWPIVVVRCGTSQMNTPIGIQVIAKPWREDVALAVAQKIEDVCGGWQASTLF